MSNKNLIIYQFTTLYQILTEFEQKINFKIIEILNEKSLNSEIKNLKNYLIITEKKISNVDNLLILNQLPIKVSKLVEKLNIEFLKHQFNNQSQINIKKYIINLNSREILTKDRKLKLTEKEINIIIYLSQNDKPISIDELQTKVWGYHSDLETHTVETHIYRLRKKFFKTFGEENFIISKKNGYKIK